MRDGLIISGWLATLFILVVIPYAGQSFGYDAYSYWSIDFDDLYGRAHEPTTSPSARSGTRRRSRSCSRRWACCRGGCSCCCGRPLMLATVAWLGGRWALVLLALPPVALELYHGNVHLLMAAAIALGFRYPWTWSFVILTKVTPGHRAAVVRGAT